MKPILPPSLPMLIDALLYAPTGSGIRIRMLDAPTRLGETLLCAAVFEGGPVQSHGNLANRLVKQVRAAPFGVTNATLRNNTIYAPWTQRAALREALASLLTPAPRGSLDALRKQIDRNTMASLIGHGSGLFKHLVGPRERRWRFAQFTLVESFSLTSMTWTAIDEGAAPHGQRRPQVVLRGGLNTARERAMMAQRLALAASLLT